MYPGDSYAPCPECSADNVVYRDICWRCGATLPFSLGLDGLMHCNPVMHAVVVSRPEAERLLDAARSLAIDAEMQHQETIRPDSTYEPHTRPSS